jgi:uncharacterized protein involved in response to NO
MNARPQAVQIRKPVPRGIAGAGPAILSYGFRPFFLAAGMFALVAMVVWIGALTGAWEVGGSAGPVAWHAHEMLFGYTSAALAGFMLTAIPNWTGRLPVSGVPLLAVVAVWLAGRVVMAAPDLAGAAAAGVIDASFLPLLALIAGREIVAGRNWRNLKVLAGLTALSAANIAYHAAPAIGLDVYVVFRFTTGIYIMLIALIGGRVVPSFTRNWLVKAGSSSLPAPFGWFDTVAVGALLVALLLWVVLPEGPATAAVCVLAAVLQAVRLWRWRGWQTLEEPLVITLHTAYAFVPIGLIGIACAAMGWLSSASALHILTVGAIGGMTVAIMTRASLGHTGRPLTATPVTSLVYFALLLSAVTRPFAEVLPDAYHLLLTASGTLWIVAFALFVGEYGPILATRDPRGRARVEREAVRAPVGQQP